MNHDPGMEEIYQPAEDTLLLLEAAKKEARPDDRAVEIGCGSALISSGVVPLVKCIIATDISPHAVRLAKTCGLEAVRTDLFKGFEAKFDLVIFNPPYLPTPDEERIDGWLNYALDGGATGRDTISRFLEDLKHHLSPRGRALLLVSSLTGLNEVKEKAESEGLEITEVASKRYFFERLYVLRLRVAHSQSAGAVNSTID
jgi:release factor glutamine methyltransferase